MRKEIKLARAFSMIPDARARQAVEAACRAALEPMRNQLLTTGTLGIKAAAKATVETGTALRAICSGSLVVLAAGDMAALSGTVAADAFNVFLFSADAGGNKRTQMGVAGATLAAVQFPSLLEDEYPIGFVIVNPTGTGDFVGGTTELDDGTVVPNAAFVNTVGPVHLNIL